MPPQTKYVFEVYFIVPAAYQNAVNAKFESYGLGPDNFTAGLSGSGNEPAQAYHATIMFKRKELKRIIWFCDNAPKAWVWVRVRTEYLHHGQAKELKRLRDNFDLEAYQDVNWQTREKAYLHIDTGGTAIQPSVALQWLSNNAVPAVNLQPITAGE